MSGEFTEDLRAAAVESLERRIAAAKTDREREALRNTLAEVKQQALSGAGHPREGADETS